MAAGSHTHTPFAVLLLAAGSSTRLGRPKQLLDYQGNALLAHSLKVALASQAASVIVVLGAHEKSLKDIINFDGSEVIVNPEWKEGMASSIRCGINTAIEKHPEVEGVIIMVCDQPKISLIELQNLFNAHRNSQKPIIASGYANTFGPPVFFHRSYFKDLLQLKNDVGARAVVRDHPEEVEIIPFPGGAIDIDTEADYERLRRTEHL